MHSIASVKLMSKVITTKSSTVRLANCPDVAMGYMLSDFN
jgi:hypothetical protein